MRIYLYRYYILTNYIKVMVYDAVNNGGVITNEIINEVIWVPYASRIVTSKNGNTSDDIASFGILVSNMSILSVLKYNLNEGINAPNIFYKSDAVTTFEAMLDEMINLTGYSDNVKSVTSSIWGSLTGFIQNQTDLQNILDSKQDDLLSGVNIKTVKGQNILGSGNIDITKSDVGLSNVDNTSDVNKPISTAIQNALNTKLSGVQVPFSNIQGQTSFGFNASINAGNLGTLTPTASRLDVYPFTPNKTLTNVSLTITVSTLGVGALSRLVIYSDLNGFPSTKIYESTDIDGSTTGDKTVLTGLTLTAGTTYWLGFYSNGIATYRGIPIGSMLSIFSSSTTTAVVAWSRISTALGTAPATFNYNTYSSATQVNIIIKQV